MPTIETKTSPTYLREARLGAGYANRGTASTVVPFSPEVIGRHERGDVPLTPDDALVYAQFYEREDIAFRFCADCPVGRVTGRTATDRDLPFATLRLTQRLRRAAKETADRLERIADDGIVDEHERPEFGASLGELQELVERATDIILYAAAQGIKKEPPCKQERPSTTKTIIPPAAPKVNPKNQIGGAI